MTYQITLSNRVNEKLRELKGKGSYSSAIEKLMEKCGIVMLDDLPSNQAPQPTTPQKREVC